MVLLHCCSEEDKLTEVTVSDKLAEFRSKQEVSAVFFSVRMHVVDIIMEFSHGF